MATDKQRLELQTKIKELIDANFADDPRGVFAWYANGRGKIGKLELMAVLIDAGVGNRITRGAWADGILDKVDTDKDGEISLAEFEAILR